MPPNFEGGGDNRDIEKKNSVHFIRHSAATYQTYADKVVSEHPMGGLDYEHQSTPDLPQKGIELATQEAEKFFASLDSERDAIFFVSSNEARAIETANIYRGVAKQKGFEVIKPQQSKSVLSDQIAGGEIRAVDNLSIFKSSQGVLDSVFQSPQKRLKINWAAIDPEYKRKFDEASKIIEADDRGSFGANLLAHGEEVKKIFPEMVSAKDQFDVQFKNLLRLVKFGIKKAKDAEMVKNVKILAFGHENYLMFALNEYFQEQGIKNCEVLQVEEEAGALKVLFRGKSVTLDK